MTRSTALTVCAVLGLATVHASAAAEDAYQPLQAYAGKWNVTLKTGRTLNLENRCTRTGLFFVCEQLVGGKSAALVIFLPQDGDERSRHYRTLTLDAGVDGPGPWHSLTIDGARWVYEDAGRTGKKGRRERTINTFSGPDFIHFEVQSSADDETWTTTASGDERRAP